MAWPELYNDVDGIKQKHWQLFSLHRVSWSQSSDDILPKIQDGNQSITNLIKSISNVNNSDKVNIKML